MALIGIAGLIGSGKDSVGTIIQQLQPDQNWQIKKFAKKLKQIASILTNIPIEIFEDQEFKKTNLSSECNVDTYTSDCKSKSVPMTVRELLQILGTDALRDQLHKDVWINSMFVDFMPDFIEVRDNEFEEVEPNWVITDMRFENEFISVKRRGGFTIRVTRPSAEVADKSKLHSSETALHNYTFDFEIVNDGSFEDLREKVKKVLDSLQKTSYI